MVVDDQHPVAVQQQLAAPTLTEQHPTRDGRLGTGDVHHGQGAVAHRDDAAPVGLDDVGLVHADHLHVRAGEVGSAAAVVAAARFGGRGGGSTVCHREVGLCSFLSSDGASPEDGPEPVAVQPVGPHAAHRLGSNVRQQGVAVVEVLQGRGELHPVGGLRRRQRRGGRGLGGRLVRTVDPGALGQRKDQGHDAGKQ